MSTAYNRRRGASADKPRPTHHQKLDPLVVEEPAAPVVSIDFGAVAPRMITKTAATRRSRSKAYAQHNEQVRCHRQRRKSRKQRKTTQKMKHRVWSR